MRRLLVLLAACGGGSSGGDDVVPPGDGAVVGDVGVPVARCQAPPLVDTSTSTVVGTGTAASCTNAALQTAATAGGIITFNCGSAPVTIAISATVTFAKESTLDGGGTVTLDGGGATRILYLDSDYNTATPRLTVQRLSFVRGQGLASGDDTVRGGGAIYSDGGSLTVIESSFDDNHAATSGQDLAGGAIYGFGGGETIVVGSTFTNNSASDGGAIGSLNRDLTVINTTLAGNAATGTGGNPGNGGCGGALYMDGRDEAASLCGVTISTNTAGAIGGGFFRVSNDHTGSFAMDQSTVDGNSVTSATDGNAGGLYLEGLAMSITGSTISRNSAFYNGGAWLSTGTVTMTNSTIAENVATGSNGGGLWLAHSPTGTILNCTIANNKSTAAGQVAGGIFGDGLTLVNTIVANNTAQYQPTCDKVRTDGSGNLQWPTGSSCTMSPLVADPMLGALGGASGDLQTLAPAAGSPAHAIGANCPATDQLGKPRATACTAGAIE